MIGLMTGVALGATMMYFGDRGRGRGRRARAKDQLRARTRRMARRRAQRARDQEHRAAGELARRRGGGHFRGGDDVDVTNHLRQVLRSLAVDTSDVTIEIAGDTARLRGEVEDARAMDAVVSAAEHAAGIERVENLLHLPGEPAPNKAPAIAASRSVGAGRT